MKKNSIFNISDSEIDFLKGLDKSDNISVDYEILDENLTDYINNKETRAFNDLIDDSEEEPWNNYINKLQKNVENINDYEFVKRSILSIASKLKTYAFIFDESLKKSTEYTEEKFNKLNQSISIAAKNVEEANKTVKNTTLKLNNAKKALNDSNDTVRNIMPDILTVLGIFVSIIVSVVIVYIEFFIDNKSVELFNKTLQLLIGKYILCTHLLGNIMFLLLFMIARLTNRSVLSTCSYYKLDTLRFKSEDEDKYESNIHRFACANCSEYMSCSFVNKIIRKANYIVAFNVFVIFLYFVDYIWWIITHYWNSGITTFCKSPDILIVILLLVSLIFFVIWSIKKYKKEYKSKK